MSHLTTNRNAWDRRVAAHVQSKFYDVAGFLAGNSSLNPIELAAMGDVQDLSLLHLQCHFGLDSLSWARLGAQVTGVDFSEVAIQHANELQAKTGLPAAFITSDIYEFAAHNQPTFDRVFSSYGVLCWLPDLSRWAQVVASCLKPGGIFCLVEFHPVIDLMAGYSYFHRDEPDVYSERTYTENAAGTEHEVAVWSHPLGDVVSALVQAGLHINSLEEFDHSPYDCFAGMVEKQPGRFYLEHNGQQVPMVYALLASKQGNQGA